MTKVLKLEELRVNIFSFFFQIKLAIFKTDNGCGWGVKTLENIRKGTFVVEYVGEVITSEEAEERGKSYGKLRKKIHLKISVK